MTDALKRGWSGRYVMSCCTMACTLRLAILLHAFHVLRYYCMQFMSFYIAVSNILQLRNVKMVAHAHKIRQLHTTTTNAHSRTTSKMKGWPKVKFRELVVSCGKQCPRVSKMPTKGGLGWQKMTGIAMLLRIRSIALPR